MKITRVYICVLILFVFFICYCFSINIVSGDSMNPSISDGQLVLTSKLSYILDTPKRNDFIVFRRDNKLMIKRIVGLPDDELVIDKENLYLNKKLLQEDYIKEPMRFNIHLEYKVPKNKYFVLGDNRNNSKDSRYMSIGYIDKSEILSRVVLFNSKSK